MRQATIVLCVALGFVASVAATLDDLGTPTVTPPGVATTVEYYLTNRDPTNNSYIPYSLAVRWDDLIPPYKYIETRYQLDGKWGRTDSWVLGEYDALRTDDGNWRISNVNVIFAWPPLIRITVITSPEGDGTTWPRQQDVYALQGSQWSASVFAMPKGGRFVRWETDERNPTVSTRMWTTWSGTAPSTNITVRLKAVFFTRNGSSPPAPAPGGTEWDGSGNADGSDLSYILVYGEAHPAGVATVTPDAVIYSGIAGGSRVVQCNAVRNEGWEGFRFVKWTGTADIYSQTGSTETGAMRASLTYPTTPGDIAVARFTAHYTYGVTVNTVAVPAAGGATWPASQNQLVVGDTYTVRANPESLSDFLYWTRDGEVISEEQVYSGTVTQEDFDEGIITLQAHFRQWTMLPLRQRVNNGFKVLTSSGVVVRDGDPKNMRLQ